MNVSNILRRHADLASVNLQDDFAVSSFYRVESDSAVKLWEYLQQLLENYQTNAVVVAHEHDYFGVSRPTTSNVSALDL